MGRNEERKIRKREEEEKGMKERVIFGHVVPSSKRLN